MKEHCSLLCLRTGPVQAESYWVMPEPLVGLDRHLDRIVLAQLILGLSLVGIGWAGPDGLFGYL